VFLRSHRVVPLVLVPVPIPHANTQPCRSCCHEPYEANATNATTRTAKPSIAYARKTTLRPRWIGVRRNTHVPGSGHWSSRSTFRAVHATHADSSKRLARMRIPRTNTGSSVSQIGRDLSSAKYDLSHSIKDAPPASAATRSAVSLRLEAGVGSRNSAFTQPNDGVERSGGIALARPGAAHRGPLSARTHR